MNELELIEEVTSSIADGKYIELLDRYEKELVYFLSKYITQDVFILFNRVILFHNKNIYNMENDYEKYDRNMHISLRMILNMHIFYYYRVEKVGTQIIGDFDIATEEFICKLKELELIYYYYPCKEVREEIPLEKKLFYQNYFKSYFFDLPEIEEREFYEFLYENTDMIKGIMEDTDFKSSLKIGYILQNFEKLIYSEKKLWNMLRYRIVLRKAGFKNFSKYKCFYVYPINLVNNFFSLNRIEYENFIEKYFFNITNRSNNSNIKMRLIDCLASDDIYIGMLDKKHIYFPRNYYWKYRWFNKIWRSKEIRKNVSEGKTYKSKKHEEEILKILNNAFGEKNVHNNLYIKREKGKYAEKDFIVTFGKYVISVEAKSKLLPEPCLDINDGLQELENKLQESIISAAKQSYEIKKAIENKKAFFYDSNNAKIANQVLNLNTYEACNFIQIAITYEEFLNLETNPECITDDARGIEFWVTDIKTLKVILNDTVMKGDGLRFIDYIQKRVKGYGVFNVQSGEELKTYNLYKEMPFIFDHDIRGKGININI
nr:hypothetical protein [Clostridium botulinum]